MFLNKILGFVGCYFTASFDNFMTISRYRNTINSTLCDASHESLLSNESLIIYMCVCVVCMLHSTLAYRTDRTRTTAANDTTYEILIVRPTPKLSGNFLSKLHFYEPYKLLPQPVMEIRETNSQLLHSTQIS